MIQQIETFRSNLIAIEVIDGFTEDDQQLFEKWFEEKINEGFDQINLLIKIDDANLYNTNTKALKMDFLWAVRNFKKIGHLALVAHSKTIKRLVPIDNFFFKSIKKGRIEKYFETSDIELAWKFVKEKDKKF